MGSMKTEQRAAVTSVRISLKPDEVAALITLINNQKRPTAIEARVAHRLQVKAFAAGLAVPS